MVKLHKNLKIGNVDGYKMNNKRHWECSNLYFNLFDTQNNGKINLNEWILAMKRLNIKFEKLLYHQYANIMDKIRERLYHSY